MRKVLVRLVCGLVVLAGLSSVSLAQNNQCDQPGEAPDVIVGSIPSVASYGSVGNLRAYSIGTTSCNIGTCWLNWFDNSPDHPVIAQNMFRYMDGRFEQLGQSWLKHGFFALSGTLCDSGCISTSGTHLGVNCSDPYSAGLNGSQSGLGPKFEVNASTGVFPWPPTDLGNTGNNIYKRLQVLTSELDLPGASYFVEGQYVTLDDAAAGNDNNNASWREISFNANLTVSMVGSTQREEAAIYAWQNEDPLVQIKTVDVPGDGRFLVGYRVTDNGNGTWHYEYAVQNLTSHRSARSFTIPIGDNATLTNVGFRDVPYHSGEPFVGTDWTSGMQFGSMVWETQTFAQNPNANALRWGTLYNFRFDANTPPRNTSASLQLFRSGSPGAVGVGVSAPDAAVCNNDSICQAIFEDPCNCPADCGSPLPDELCFNGIDDDCDGLLDCADQNCCGLAGCAPVDDTDSDGYDSTCDCDDNNADVHGVPGETLNVELLTMGGGDVQISWDPPLDFGGASVVYDVIRSIDKQDWIGAGQPICVAADEPFLSVIDTEPSTVGQPYYYLVRAVNDCPLNAEGTLGTRTDGINRKTISCP